MTRLFSSLTMTLSLRTVALAVAGSLVTLATVPAAHAQSSQKIVYVQLQKILSQAPGRSDAEATYNREMEAARGEIKRMDDSLKTLIAGFDKDAATMDSAKREARRQSVGSVEEQYTRRAQALNQGMQQRQADLSKPLMEQLSMVLDEIRKKNGYAFILDVNAAGSSVVSADTAYDITDDVLARLKQLGPPKASAAPSSQVPLPSGPSARPSGVTRPRG